MSQQYYEQQKAKFGRSRDKWVKLNVKVGESTKNRVATNVQVVFDLIGSNEMLQQYLNYISWDAILTKRKNHYAKIELRFWAQYDHINHVVAEMPDATINEIMNIFLSNFEHYKKDITIKINGTVGVEFSIVFER